MTKNLNNVSTNSASSISNLNTTSTSLNQKYYLILIYMINLDRAVGLFNRFSPKISKVIGQVANIARNFGQAVQNVRDIGSTVNSMSGGR